MAQNSDTNSQTYESKTVNNVHIDYQSSDNNAEEQIENYQNEQFNEDGINLPDIDSYSNDDMDSLLVDGSPSPINSNIFFLLPLYYICSECQRQYSFKKVDNKNIRIECGCKIVKNCNSDEFIHKYCSLSNLNNLGCKKHSKKDKIQKYTHYCKDCKKNLCAICLESKSQYINNKGIVKEHETHELINLLSILPEIEEKKKLFNIINNNDTHEVYIKNLINNLLDHYEQSPNYYAYKAIKSCKEFLKSTSNSDNNKEQELNPENLIKISSIKELKEKIHSSRLIGKIEIESQDTDDILEDLKIFENKVFNELTVLHLENIKTLTDIKALYTCFFPKLKKLIIEKGNLGNDCIHVIKKLNLPEIKHLSFFDNNITSPEIFETIKNFPNLELFYIGCNPIEVNDLKDENFKYIFPESLKELGISDIFTNETNPFIFNHLNLENIQSLYLNGDGFTTLKMFENKNLKLKELWIRGSEKGYIKSIEELNYLKYIKSLEKIVLKQNKIKDIEKLVDIISNFPNLKLLNIQDNEIEEIKVEKIREILKEKGYEYLEIESQKN